MNLPTVWLCSFVGIAFFVLTAWLDGQDVERFAGTKNEYSVEGERLLWLRITIRQLAAFALVMMLDAVFVIIAEAEGTRLMEASRLFLGLAEGTNLLRLHYYYRLIRQAEQRARLSQAWRGSRQ